MALDFNQVLSFIWTFELYTVIRPYKIVTLQIRNIYKHFNYNAWRVTENYINVKMYYMRMSQVSCYIYRQFV